MNERHCLTLRNNRAEIARMMSWVVAVIERFALPPRTTNAIQLCLEEAVTNIVTHGFAPDTVHDINVVVWPDDAAVHVELTDDGHPFDPLAHELPAASKDLQSVPIGGLGIKLMRNFADHMSYRHSGGVNRLTLSFMLRQPASAGMARRPASE